MAGAFVVNMNNKQIRTISSGPDSGWEHVSVSLKHRTPTWDEMCFVKDLFWEEDECVIQYHPAKSDYVNFHPYCLHMWKPIEIEIPKPPSWMVGPKNA